MAAELNPVLADVPAMSPELRKVYDVLRELLGEQAPPEGEHDLVVGAFAGFKPLSVHRLAMKGVQKHLARKFSSAFLLLPRKEVLRVIGVSERTLQRAEDDDVLDARGPRPGAGRRSTPSRAGPTLRLTVSL